MSAAGAVLGRGAEEAVAEWHVNNPKGGKMPKIVQEIVMMIDVEDDDKKAVAALLRKHKAPGEAIDWLPA